MVVLLAFRASCLQIANGQDSLNEFPLSDILCNFGIEDGVASRLQLCGKIENWLGTAHRNMSDGRCPQIPLPQPALLSKVLYQGLISQFLIYAMLPAFSLLVCREVTRRSMMSSADNYGSRLNNTPSEGSKGSRTFQSSRFRISWAPTDRPSAFRVVACARKLRLAFTAACEGIVIGHTFSD